MIRLPKNKDPELRAHQEWLGYVQPVGLVVSVPALLAAQAHVNRNIVPEHRRFLDWVKEVQLDDGEDPVRAITDLRGLLEKVFRWEPGDLVGGNGDDPQLASLELTLPEYNETLRPTYAVKEIDPEGENASPWLMLLQVIGIASDFDKVAEKEERRWQASAQARFERLLREKEIPIGLLTNGTHLRLVYAPRGETSGHVTFPVQAMSEVAGRSIFAALHTLLSADRLFTLPRKQRLATILSESRKYQNEVSAKLADQVLGALWELLRGFQAADEVSNGRLIDQTTREDPNHIYGGLLTVLLRLVFLLYAEDQGLMADDSVYTRNYSVTKLYERLREDAGHFPDTMDQRYGAWAWLLSLFRMVFDGGDHGNFHLPTRHGQLFNPDEYPFLEGRPYGVARVMGERFEVPLVSDGCIHRVLQGLLVLGGERLSYRSLDVEQIGSVYEAMMGYSVERSSSRSLAVRPKHVVFDVDILLEVEPGKRGKWLRDTTECDLAGNAATAVKAAETAEDVVAALGRKVSHRTPQLLPPGTLYLQPTEERRRSGSHYTPRELTEPIVRTTLRPVLEALGKRPKPEQILDLKVCDLTMGSGAFLVETCRQLAEKLVESWSIHDCMPDIPPDEEPLLHARRLIAQRCLYGVDKNPFAVNLAKLSLWLVTLAKDHAFTFIDHALKCGDSLLGLSLEQIRAFTWKTKKKDFGPLFEGLTEAVSKANIWRAKLQAFGEGEYLQKKEAHREAEDALHDARLTGDLVIAAFFGAERDRAREDLRLNLRNKVDVWRAGQGNVLELQSIVDILRSDPTPAPAFHWKIEFPEVFDRERPGFDAFVGNPPFVRGKRISTFFGSNYLDWLATCHEETNNCGDLVAHFFRRAFSRIRDGGTIGLIGTDTISEGDTRHTGLRWICKSGGEIYSAVRKFDWPGAASVFVSIVHIYKGDWLTARTLDNRIVDKITAFLFHQGSHDDPAPLLSNEKKCFCGPMVYGTGFTFDDSDTTGKASSIATMREIVRSEPRYSDLISPYLGGAEFNAHPSQSHHRYVINFGEMSLEEAKRFPELLRIVEEKVKPERELMNRKAYRERWWQFAEKQTALLQERVRFRRCLMHPFTFTHLAFAFVPAETVIAGPHYALLFEEYHDFCVLQSRLHDVWVKSFASTIGHGRRYAASDTFRTFPFPEDWQTKPTLEAAGKIYYEFRADLMVKNDEGLTRTYNRFHDPGEQDPGILRLRDLHAAMDRAVLDAYGWSDLRPTCEFLLDYEEDEDDDDSGPARKRKKPWRYCWPNNFRDEVLARLLVLNQKRAEQERRRGVTAKGKSKKGRKSKARSESKNQTGKLFE